MARILIVDDVSLIREIVSAFLEKRGHRVFSAASGPDALKIANEKRLHLIVTDVNMPGMDGIALIEKLREIPHQKVTPIIVLANGAKDENVSRATSAGANDWVAKPFTEESLINKINQVLVDFHVL
jgi:two-component system, chemotaxis family, chemotaxis protein CheY